jgi:copper chaperone CopZ
VSTQTFSVNGMNCQHCVDHVTEEVGALAGVSAVEVALVPGGTSTVTVTAAQPVAEAQMATALDEAGAYTLA